MRNLTYPPATPTVFYLRDGNAGCYDRDMAERDAPGERYLSILEPGGRLALPPELREKLGWRPGEALVLTVEDGGTVRLASGAAEEAPAEGSSSWKQAVQASAGMWKDREDLPDWKQLRQEWDRGDEPES